MKKFESFFPEPSILDTFTISKKLSKPVGSVILNVFNEARKLHIPYLNENDFVCECNKMDEKYRLNDTGCVMNDW